MCSEQLLAVINDVLDWSKMEVDKVHMDNKPFNLRQLLEDAIEIVFIKSNKKSIDLILEMDQNLPSIVHIDIVRMRQILSNLLTNSVKFSAENTEIILYVVMSKRIGEDEAEIEFHVKDDGIGINEDVQSKLFQPFFQVDGSLSRQQEGSGLGLSISRRLVELMGGKMWFKSQENVGTTFSFAVTMQVEYQQKVIPSQNKRIGIFHPSERVRTMLKDSLECLGFSVLFIDDKDKTATSFDTLFIHSKATKEDILLFKKFASQVVVLGNTKVEDSISFPRALTSKNLDTFFSTDKISWKSEPKGAKLSLRILVAEDNLINQKVIAKILAKMGVADLMVVDNGRKAVEACQSKIFDLVLMVTNNFLSFSPNN